MQSGRWIERRVLWTGLSAAAYSCYTEKYQYRRKRNTMLLFIGILGDWEVDIEVLELDVVCRAE